MTLRDYFAGQYIAGRFARPMDDNEWGDIAEAAYLLADAMLAARGK
jgi:hypothetical protein